MGGQLTFKQERSKIPAMRIHSVLFAYMAFGLVALSFAARKGDAEGDRIVGGNEVEAHSIPWQVGLSSKNSRRTFCGGTILSATKILTAAHCYTDPSEFQVIVKEHDLGDNDDGVRHDVTSFENHPNYNQGAQLNNDFAIITLSKAIELGDKAEPAVLPAATMEINQGQFLTVSGWGRLESGGNSPDELHAVKVPYITNAQCQEAYGEQYRITNRMMCAGNVENGGIDSCQGDSGGPLVMGNTIVGVVSWGIGCAEPGYPGVYARVTEVLGWINSNTGGGEEPVTQQPEEPNDVPENPNPLECNLAWVGDGVCDARNNNEGCFFDGNDCCNPEADMQFCKRSIKGCRCKRNAFRKCESESYVNDGYCDRENNNSECNYDGGDCCTRREEDWTGYCTGAECNCIFPTLS